MVHAGCSRAGDADPLSEAHGRRGVIVARSRGGRCRGERLAADTLGREQELRDLIHEASARCQNLREVLEERRLWMWKQVLRAATGLAALYAIPSCAGHAVGVTRLGSGLRFSVEDLKDLRCSAIEVFG